MNKTRPKFRWLGVALLTICLLTPTGFALADAPPTTQNYSDAVMGEEFASNHADIKPRTKLGQPGTSSYYSYGEASSYLLRGSACAGFCDGAYGRSTSRSYDTVGRAWVSGLFKKNGSFMQSGNKGPDQNYAEWTTNFYAGTSSDTWRENGSHEVYNSGGVSLGFTTTQIEGHF